MQLGDLSTSRYLKTRASIVAFFLREGKREKEKEKKRKEKKRERRRQLLDPGIMIALPWSDLKKTASSVFREHSVSSIYIIIYRKEQRRGEIVYDATRSSLGNSLPLLSNSHSSQNENHINSFSTLHYRTRWKQFRREKKIIPLPRTESVHKFERNNSPPSSRSNFPRNRNIIISNPSKIFNQSARQNFTLCTLYFPLSASSASVFPRKMNGLRRWNASSKPSNGITLFSSIDRNLIIRTLEASIVERYFLFHSYHSHSRESLKLLSTVYVYIYVCIHILLFVDLKHSYFVYYHVHETFCEKMQ